MKISFSCDVVESKEKLFSDPVLLLDNIIVLYLASLTLKFVLLNGKMLSTSMVKIELPRTIPFLHFIMNTTLQLGKLFQGTNLCYYSFKAIGHFDSLFVV